MAPKVVVSYVGLKSIFWNVGEEERLPAEEYIPAEEHIRAEEHIPAEGQLSPNPSIVSLSQSQNLQLTQSQSVPTTDEEVIESFRQYIGKEIEDLESEYAPTNVQKTRLSEKKASLLFLLALTFEASKSPHLPKLNGMNEHDSLESYFEAELLKLIGPGRIISDIWNGKEPLSRLYSEEDGGDQPEKKRKTDQGKAVEPKPSKSKSRTSSDESAQNTVKPWYDNRCVFTGRSYPEGAHILAVRITGSQRIKDFWANISLFWPKETVHEWQSALEKDKYHVTNILPLSPDAHEFWDRLRFAIRPIADPEEPQRRIFLQLVWLSDFSRTTGVVAGPPDHKKISIMDRERSDGKVAPIIQHGDIYQLVTTNPDLYPLPSYALLSVQYALHRVMSSLPAAGSLKTMFGGDPPDIDPVVQGEVSVPKMWARLLDDAVEAGVLDRPTAQQWGAAFGVMEEAEAREEERWAAKALARWEAWEAEEAKKKEAEEAKRKAPDEA
jgi:hypothetical protein